jgi:hypothetical protein
MNGTKACVGLAGLLALGACAVTPPQGPSVMVMPGKDKTFEAFQGDDLTCRSAASQSIGGQSAGQAAAQSTIGSAAVGTGLGAAAGALAGSAVGAVGTGAAVGAGAGLLLGSAAGAGAGQQSYYQMQSAYDMTYVQCMASKGNQVPQASTSPYPAAYPGPAYYYAPYPGYYYRPYPGYYYRGYPYGYY